MGELVDRDLLETGRQELARAQGYAQSQARGEKARQARLRAVRGSTAARKDLGDRWAAVDSSTLDKDALAKRTPPPVAP